MKSRRLNLHALFWAGVTGAGRIETVLWVNFEKKEYKQLWSNKVDLVRFYNLLWTKYYKINVTRGHSITGHDFAHPILTNYLDIFYPECGQKWIFLEQLTTLSSPHRIWTTLYIEHFFVWMHHHCWIINGLVMSNKDSSY